MSTDLFKFERYPEYKSSGVEWLGDIPKDWNIFSLKRAVTKCINGIWGDEANGIDDTVVIRVADFDRNKLDITEDKLTYRSISNSEKNNRLLKKGDLLIEKSGGGEKTLVGCVVLFDKDFPAVTSNFVAKMSPKRYFDGGFLNYAFNHLYSGNVNYPSIKQTTGIQNLDSDSYLMEYFCFPSMNEQEKISSFLNYEIARIDRLIAKQQQLIELLKEKRQAVISHVVTKGLNPDVPMKDSGVEWLGQVPEHWVVTKAKHVSSIFVPQRNKPELNSIGDGIAWATMEDMKSDEISCTNYSVSQKSLVDAGSKILPTGAVIASCVGNFGITSINKIDVIINQQLQAYIPKKINAIYFSALISCSKCYFELIGTAATLVYVNQEGFSNLPVLIPPPNEQTEIESYVALKKEKFDSLISQVMKQITLLRERRSALISSAVTGKIDLRNWVPPVTPSNDVA